MASNIETILTEIWDQIDQADELKNRDRKRELIAEPISRLRRLLEEGCDAALYPLGYAYYVHPDRKPGSPEEGFVEYYLYRAIERGVEPDLSKLYLAYQAYDQQRYRHSCQLATEIDHSRISEMCCIRSRELILCNRLRLSEATDYDWLLSEYAQFIGALEEPDIPPLNLMDTLEELCNTGRLPKSCLHSLTELDRVYTIMNDQWFQNLLRAE